MRLAVELRQVISLPVFGCFDFDIVVVASLLVRLVLDPPHSRLLMTDHMLAKPSLYPTYITS